MLLLQAGVGFTIGLSLGLLGGGGSILTVPALVYLLGQNPQSAITTSLAIVGANSLMGASFHRSRGTLDWTVALTFGSIGMVVSYLASGISKSLPPAVLLVLFAALMLLVGLFMFFRSNPPETHHAARSLPIILAAGAGVGLLTGILGVGGGFLIVPVLVMLVGLRMQVAVGTSLVVIAMNSLAGLIGHLGGEPLNLILLAIFLLSGLLGTFTGSKIAHRLPARNLQKTFAGFVILLALFLLADNLQKLIGS